MAVSLLLLFTTCVLGFVVSRQLLGARRLWEALSLAPLLACFAIIGGANAWGPVAGRWPTIAVSCVGSLLLMLWPRGGGEGEPEEGEPGVELAEAGPAEPSVCLEPPLSRRWFMLLGVVVAAVVGYVAYAQALQLDTDNWIHEPLIAGYTLGIFPPVHPFFPDSVMNGHYGRDLLMGTLLPRGWDPLLVVWILNPILALCSVGVLLAIFRRWGDTPSSLLCAVVLPFFGVCAGFRVGLADTFDGNNGVVYALAIPLFYVMLRVFELLPGARPGFGLWCVAGVILGIYQVVYETHFGLFLLTGAVLLVPALWTSQHRGRVLCGMAVTVALALALACTEGGPLTDLAHRSKASASQAEANTGQHVSVSFPKKNLFCVLATSAEYTRISPGFRLEAFRKYAPAAIDEGYLNIFSPSFLVTHWMPLFCAPFTLLWLLRRRHWPGLAFWAFGAWAYLVPGLVDFGPLYEWEYFRWEFAAAFAFAVPLGLMCGSMLDAPASGEARDLIQREDGVVRIVLDRRLLVVLAGWVLLWLSLWPAEKMINRAIIDVQKYGWPWQIPAGAWRVARPELGVNEADIRCAQKLAEQILPGEVVLTNLGSESPLGLWPDCVVSALSGARVAGRAHPPEGVRIHAFPNYHRSALQKALTTSARPDLLWNSGVTWLLLDPDAGPLDEALSRSPHALLVCREKTRGGIRRDLWKLAPPPSLAISRLPSQPPFRSQVLFLPGEGGTMPLDKLEGREWRTNTPYRLRVAAFNARERDTARLGWLRIEIRDGKGRRATDPITYLLGANPLPAGTGDLHEVIFVTPLIEGDFTVVGELLQGDKAATPLFSFPLKLSLLERLVHLQASMEVPGDVAPQSFVPLKLTLSSTEPLHSKGELELLTRLHQVGGDYVWELDRIPTALDLSLDRSNPSVAGRQVLEWNIFAPARAGTYEIELEIFDKATGNRVPLPLSPAARITVVGK